MFELHEVTETDPAYMLRPEKIDFLNVLKPKEGDNVKKLMREFLDTTPGYDSLRYIGKMNLEHRNYYRKRTNLPDGEYFFEFLRLESDCFGS